jgi:hypothetical protein
MDFNLYKSTSNFRIVYSNKINDDRIKMPLEGKDVCNKGKNALNNKGKNAASIANYLVTANSGNGINLPKINMDIEYNEIIKEIDDLEVKNIISKIDTKGHNYRNAYYYDEKTLSISFNREYPTYCKLCKEVHHKDNTLIVHVYNNKVYELCRHSQGRKLFLFNVKLEEEDGEDIGNLVNEENIAHNTLFDLLPDDQKNVYNKPKMEQYEYVGTLAIQAQMKMGKTNQLAKSLDNWYPRDSIKIPKIICVTFRITFTNDFKMKFPDFVAYNNVQGPLNQPKLIVQVESLHRLQINRNTEKPTCVIIDEVESVLEQFSSKLIKNHNAVWAAFEWLLKTAEQLIVMDANLSDRTFRVLQRMRPDFPIYFHKNAFLRALDDNYKFTNSYDILLYHMLEDIKKGKKIVVASNNLRQAEIIHSILCSKFPDREILFYSSKTLASLKNKHFENVSKYWKVDILMYTPTVTAGISFEEKWFDVLYGYFNDQSCTVETCRQMIGRVRNISNFNIYLNGRRKNLPTSIDIINKLVHNKRSMLFSDANISGLTYSYDDNGDLKYYQTSYYYLWLENIRMSNLSKNNFKGHFINQVKDSGATTGELEIDNAGVKMLRDVNRTRIDNKLQVKEDNASRIVNADILSPEELMAVSAKLKSGEDVNGDLIDSYNRTKLVNTYNWRGKHLTCSFVKDYSNLYVKKWYFNISALFREKSVEDSLEFIRKHEYGLFNGMMQSRNVGLPEFTEISDLNINYKYHIYSLSLQLMLLLGYNKDIRISRIQHPNELYANICNNYKYIIDSILPMLQSDINLFIPSMQRLANNKNNKEKFISLMLQPVNDVMQNLYGYKIKRCRHKNKYINKETVYYTLYHKALGKLFNIVGDFDKNINITNIPLIVCNYADVDTSREKMKEFIHWKFYSEINREYEDD